MPRLLQALLIPFVFFVDRFSKIAVLKYLPQGEGIPLWPGVFHLTRVENTGAAFGLLKGTGSFLTIVSMLCVVLLGAYLTQHFLKGIVSLRTTAAALVIAGALGNLYDRLRYGVVIDFLDFRIWPVFNIADISICVGVVLVAWTLIKQ